MNLFIRRKKPAAPLPQIHKPRREQIAIYKFPEPLTDIPNMVLFSDLHLYGKNNKSISVFPENVRELFKMLHKYHDQGYELYGLGDILEGWRFNTKQILKMHPDFVWFLNNNVHIIRGNHDWTAWKRIEKQFGKKTHEFLQVGPIFMSHGHQADPLNRRSAWYSRYATKLAGYLKRAGINMDKTYRKTKFKHADKIKQRYENHTLAVQNTIAPTAKIFCYGHLHMPYLDTSLENIVIVNLGSIANYARIFSYVEITATELTLWKVTL
ncbi:MAG: metallophosphoesterase family protein [Candidatus Magasanikbacteria bacterium]|nr:metallophosphoesterase family protein [Candidatus Magasanikbacteria bacterium]